MTSFEWGTRFSPRARIFLLVPVLTVAAAGAALIYQRLRDEVQLRSPVSDEIRDHALLGVTANGDWQPVLRRHGGLGLVLVPAGCFVQGTTDAQLQEAQSSCDRAYGAFGCPVDFAASEQPAREVCISEPFWIGRTEVTNRQYGSSSSIEMARAPRWPRDTVTWSQAAAFCEDRGQRLPTEAEWEYAARGPDNLIYPWGDVFNRDALVWFRLKPVDAASIEAGASWVGAMDMSGGMLEWTADRFRPYGDPPDENGNQAELRVARGGSWFSRASYLVRSAHRYAYEPDFASSITGFRCAMDFE